MLSALVTIARDVGTHLLEWRDGNGTSGAWVGTQFKAEADRQAHRLMVSALTDLAPDIPVVSEEDASSFHFRGADRYFLIDPIDGTASYAHGFAGFVTQMALMESGQPVVSVVHAPVLERTWFAARGHGAFRDETRLRADSPPGRLLVIDNYPEPRGIAATMVRDLPATGYLECGSIALKACRIADGTADLFVKDVVVRDWDVAPADLILQEAGGRLLDAVGRAPVYTGDGDLHGIVTAIDPEIANRALAILGKRKT